MILEINDILVSSALLEEHFICDLSACKGACCIEGDGGAPLTEDEIEIIQKNYEKIQVFMDKKSIKTIENKNFFYTDEDQEKLTELNVDGSCVFAVKEKNGCLSCAIEKANQSENFGFHKPISCHLYPLRVNKVGEKIALNYHQWSICKAACALGQKEKVKVYQFLKTPIIRVFGEDFFRELDEIAQVLPTKNIN